MVIKILLDLMLHNLQFGDSVVVLENLLHERLTFEGFLEASFVSFPVLRQLLATQVPPKLLFVRFNLVELLEVHGVVEEAVVGAVDLAVEIQPDTILFPRQTEPLLMKHTFLSLVPRFDIWASLATFVLEGLVLDLVLLGVIVRIKRGIHALPVTLLLRLPDLRCQEARLLLVLQLDFLAFDEDENAVAEFVFEVEFGKLVIAIVFGGVEEGALVAISRQTVRYILDSFHSLLLHLFLCQLLLL